MDDLISRQAAIDAMESINDSICEQQAIDALCELPSAQPERLTDDDFETIRIHLNAQKEKLCNQHRWKEAEEYQRIIDRFMAFASAQPERKKGKWIKRAPSLYRCLECGRFSPGQENFCPNCGAEMEKADER